MSNNRPSFHSWRRENLVKRKKVSENYENDCLQNLLSLVMSLLTAKFVRNSHTYGRICSFFLKNSVRQN